MRAAAAKFQVAPRRRFVIPQQLDRAEPVLLILPMLLEISLPFPGSGFQGFGSRPAVQGRYNQNLFLGVLTCSLQSIAERPLPCNYFHGGNTGSNPVGDAKPYQRFRGTEGVFRGHKKEQQNSKISPFCRFTTAFPKICRFVAFFVGTKRHRLTPQSETTAGFELPVVAGVVVKLSVSLGVGLKRQPGVSSRSCGKSWFEIPISTL